MALYALNRNYVFRSLLGHSVEFVKNTPTFVPPLIEREVVAIGAQRVDGENPDVLDAETAPIQAPLTPAERAEQIGTAFDLLVERNDSKDFTAAGVPSVKSVERILGFDVDRTEVSEAWTTYRAKSDE